MQKKKRKAAKSARRKAKPRVTKPVRKEQTIKQAHIITRENISQQDRLFNQQEIAQEFFAPKKHTFKTWVKRYSPVLVTMFIALMTYFYLVFYLFYPTTIVQGHYIQLLLVIVFIFLIAGLIVYLGLRSELLFIRIISFFFIFILFTLLLLFILLAHSLAPQG